MVHLRSDLIFLEENFLFFKKFNIDIEEETKTLTLSFFYLKYKMQNDLNKKLLKILPFYDSVIDILSVKKLSNVELLKEIHFYDDLSSKL